MLQATTSTQGSRQERTLPALLYLFTAVTGLVDAVSFFGLGHVFTANMTGNVVFLGFAAAGAPDLSVTRSLAALAAFLFGALVGGRLAASLVSHRWTTAAFGSEAILLFGATLVSIGYRPASLDLTRLYALIVLTAIAMGIRNATVRKMGLPDLTTTVLTLTITGLAADSSLAGGSNPRWQRRVISIILMFSGAAVGVVLLKHSLALALGVATLSAVCGVAALFRKREAPGADTNTQG
jgi:uncharacterized membrane protein YoaK (UPF0700 family)